MQGCHHCQSTDGTHRPGCVILAEPGFCPICQTRHGKHILGCPEAKTVAQQEADKSEPKCPTLEGETKRPTSQSLRPEGEVLDVAQAMSEKTAMNDWFHQKFNEVTEGVKFQDQRAVFIVRQLCYAFYRQGMKVGVELGKAEEKKSSMLDKSCPPVAVPVPFIGIPAEIVEAANKVGTWMHQNGQEFWELGATCDRRWAVRGKAPKSGDN